MTQKKIVVAPKESPVPEAPSVTLTRSLKERKGSSVLFLIPGVRGGVKVARSAFGSTAETPRSDANPSGEGREGAPLARSPYPIAGAPIAEGPGRPTRRAPAVRSSSRTRNGRRSAPICINWSSSLTRSH